MLGTYLCPIPYVFGKYNSANAVMQLITAAYPREFVIHAISISWSLDRLPDGC